MFTFSLSDEDPRFKLIGILSSGQTGVNSSSIAITRGGDLLMDAEFCEFMIHQKAHPRVPRSVGDSVRCVHRRFAAFPHLNDAKILNARVGVQMGCLTSTPRPPPPPPKALP